MNKSPSRILNERIGFLGLSILDIGVIGYTLILSHAFLSLVHLELLAFPITGVTGIALLGVRQKFRAKIIRDYLAAKLSRKINSGGPL